MATTTPISASNAGPTIDKTREALAAEIEETHGFRAFIERQQYENEKRLVDSDNSVVIAEVGPYIGVIEALDMFLDNRSAKLGMTAEEAVAWARES